MACDDNGGIGKDGSLPWPRNKKDLQYFRELTLNHVVVMGRATWNSGMPKPLAHRKNYVVSRTASNNTFPEADGALLATDIDNQIAKLKEQYPEQIVWMIGGAILFQHALHLVDEIYLNRIKGDYDCDTFIPLPDIEKQFNLEQSTASDDVTYQIWRRKVNATV